MFFGFVLWFLDLFCGFLVLWFVLFFSGDFWPFWALLKYLFGDFFVFSRLLKQIQEKETNLGAANHLVRIL